MCRVLAPAHLRLKHRQSSSPIREMDYIYVYDNSRWGQTPLVLLQAEKGEIQFQAENIPSWLANVIQQL